MPPTTSDTLDSARVELYLHGSAPEGAHWQSMRPAGENLREVLRDMAAATRLYSADATAADLERLEVLHATAAQADPSDVASDWLDGWLLELRAARWTLGQEGALARLVVVLGTGGPHVELDALFGPYGDCEEIVLEQRWSGTRGARTRDGAACRIVDAWCAAFVVGES